MVKWIKKVTEAGVALEALPSSFKFYLERRRDWQYHRSRCRPGCARSGGLGRGRCDLCNFHASGNGQVSVLENFLQYLTIVHSIDTECLLDGLCFC